jgi:hypothetical protein
MYIYSIYTGPIMYICIYRNARFSLFVSLQCLLSQSCIRVRQRERREEKEVKREGRVRAYTHTHLTSTTRGAEGALSGISTWRTR